MLPWDHNVYYHRLLLSAVPRSAARVLEVGCGAGQLATRLATRAEHVDAIDRDAGMVTAARAAVPANVTCWQADMMDTSLAPESYDAVVSMSTLHHLPLVPALSRLATAVRPGGMLAAIAQPRTELPHELPLELAATTWHHALGLALTVTRYRGNEQLRRGPHHDAMPVHEPELTTRQVRDRARSALPGVRVRRLILWRYLLLWCKAADRSPAR